MPKVTEAHFEARKKQILDAATVCFSKKGFHKCTMQDICKTAKLSTGAVYRYFNGKEEIIKAMADESMKRDMAIMKEISDRGYSAEQELGELAGAFFGMLDNPDGCSLELSIELWAESLRNPKIMRLRRGIVDGTIGAIAGIIQRAQARNEINPQLNPEYVARVMVSHFDGLILQKATDPDVDIWKFVETMREMTSLLMDKKISNAKPKPRLRGNKR